MNSIHYTERSRSETVVDSTCAEEKGPEAGVCRCMRTYAFGWTKTRFMLCLLFGYVEKILGISFDTAHTRSFKWILFVKNKTVGKPIILIFEYIGGH